MSETCAIEVYENQVYYRLRGWLPHGETPFSMKPSNIPCKPLEEISLPSVDWAWMTNWKTSKMPGVTDADGWEYATKFSSFQNKSRAARAEGVWSRARRRLWIRVMRRDATIRSADLSKALAKVQTGLSSVHMTRLKIEQITKQAPDAAESEQMISLANSVQRNIADLLTILDQAEAQPPGKTDISPAVVKKLKNDVIKEEAAIMKALEKRPERSATTATSYARPNAATTAPTAPAAAPGRSRGAPADRTISSDLRQISSMVPTTNKGVVSSGQKGAFDPRVFGNSSSSGNPFDDQDGVFVERTIQEQMIDQKLVAIDEATIMQEIIDDRSNEIKKVHKGLVELNEVFVEISKLVKEQELDMNQILGNTDESHVRTKEAYEHIVEANRLHAQGNCAIS